MATELSSERKRLTAFDIDDKLRVADGSSSVGDVDEGYVLAMSKPRYASDATTLAEVTHNLEAEGFVGQFSAVDDGEVLCFTCHQRSPSFTVELDALHRTEGASDPDDMVAVGAVVCPICNTRGTLVLKYGADSTPEDADALRQLEDHRASESGGTQPSR